MTMELTVVIIFIGMAVVLGMAFMFLVKAMIEGIIEINQAKNREMVIGQSWK